ncbi:MAG: MATE family efflux transporter [Pontibacterium sp.]
MKATAFKKELSSLVSLGWPIMIAQLSQTGIGFVDTVMAGQYSTLDLAAIGVGAGLWLPIFLASVGILMATTPLVAQRWGKQDLNGLNQVITHAVLIALTLGVASFFLLRNLDPVFEFMALSPELAQKTDDYLSAFAWGMPAGLLFQVVRSCFEGVGDTKPVMYLSLLCLLINIPLNYVLIFGHWGFPELGSAGCGYASAAAFYLLLIGGLLSIRRHPELAPHLSKSPVSPAALGQFLALGVPIGFSLLIEASMFAIIALFLADLGPTVVGAHQVTLSYTGLIFMLPLSISFALTIRVGHHLGAGQPERAKTSTQSALILTAAIAITNALLMVFAGHWIVRIYSNDPEILALATGLLAIAGAFQCSDAIQVTCAGALRGAKDTFVPLVMVFCCYWALGFPVGYLLAKTDLLTSAPLGAAGFWYALVGALTCSAVLLWLRFRNLFTRLQASEA